MFKLDQITTDWKEAGAFQQQINVFAFWDENTFMTKSGDLGCAIRVGGIDYESLDHAARDYAVRRLEAAFRSLDERMRLYQLFFKQDDPTIPFEQYENPLVQASTDQRMAFLDGKRNQLHAFDFYWIVTIDGSYVKTGILHALSQIAKSPRRALRELRSLLRSNQQRTLLYEQIERDHTVLDQHVKALIRQMSDLMKAELLGSDEIFRLDRRLVNFSRAKFEDVRLHSPEDLDWQLCGSELEAHRGYLRLDEHFVRVLTLKELPSETRPLLLNGILDIPANFHVISEWHPVDGARSRKEIGRRRRHYHNSKTSFLSNFQDRQSTGPRDELVDDSKEAAIGELGEALTAISMDDKSFGEYTLSVVIYDEDRRRVDHAVAEFQKLFSAHDGVLYEERYNLLNAFFATVPGNRQFNLRKLWALNSNHADLSFAFTVGSGDQKNKHLEREYLAVLESAHGTPYYLNLHSGDVAHTLVLGATGSGKSFTLNFLIQSLQKYSPLTFIFDLGASYESLTGAFGGTYLNVGVRNPGFSINPFSLGPTDENLNFLYQFLRVLIEAEGRYELTTADEKALFAAIGRQYKLPAEIRTLTNFASILGPLGDRLHRWTQAGQFGYLFDNVEDTLTFSKFQTFNFDGWNDYPDVLEPLLFYVLQRASSEIEKPENMATFKAFVIDEAWMFLKNRTIRDWVTRAEKTWRKKNAAMILATQSVVELMASEMLHIVNESCPTKIFLANPNIDRKLYAEIFQLNDVELEMLESLTPKRDLLLKQPGLAKRLRLEVDALTYWIATNNARDNLRKQKYFARFGPEQGLLRLAKDFPNPNS